MAEGSLLADGSLFADGSLSAEGSVSVSGAATEGGSEISVSLTARPLAASSSSITINRWFIVQSFRQTRSDWSLSLTAGQCLCITPNEWVHRLTLVSNLEVGAGRSLAAALTNFCNGLACQDPITHF